MGGRLEPWLLLLLVSVGPFVSFYAHNLHENLHPAELAPYALGTFALAGGLFACLRAGRAEPGRAATAIAITTIAFFHYHDVSRALGQVGASTALQLAAWTALWLGGLGVAVALRRRPLFRRFLLVYAALSLAPPLTWIATYDLPGQGPGLPLERAYPLEGNEIWSGEPTRTPNVYWIVPDSYPSFRLLRDHYGFDNGAFLAYLETRGFVVGRDTYANFSTTRLSVPTTLNMEYVFDEGETWSVPRGRENVALPGRTNRGVVAAITGDNRSVAYWKQIGYRYVHFEGRSFQLTRCRGREDVCIRGRIAGPSELQHNLLSLLPYRGLYELSPRFRRRFEPRRRSASGTGIPELGEALARLALEPPFFLYAHLASPHRPFLNAADCSLLPPDFDRRGNRHFLNQLQCVNRHLRDLIDGIVERDPEALVVLSSDHGPRYSVRPGTPLFSLDRRQIRESLGILAAFRLPADCRSDLDPDRAPVNHLRVVFACLGGHEPRLLEDKHFIARPERPNSGMLRRVSPR